MLAIDSAGGDLDNAAALADEIRALTAHKKIVGYVEGHAASSGYRIACGCSTLYAAPSSLVGSMKIRLHLANDDSANLCVVGSPWDPLERVGRPMMPMDEARRTAVRQLLEGALEQWVQQTARLRAVRADTVRAQFLDKAIHSGYEARQVGMIDAVEPPQQFLKDLARELAAPAACRRCGR